MAEKKSFGDSFGGQMLSGLGGSFVNGLFNIGAAKRQYKYQSKLQRQQYNLNEQAATNAYERQKDFYNLQNEYNDPSAVRERYENAGINPTSAFGTAGSYTPAQQSATVPQGGGAGLGSSSAFPISDPIEQAYRLAMIRNVDADTKQKEGNTLDPEETLRGQKLANDLQAAGLISIDLKNQLDALNLQFKNEVYDTEVTIRKQTADNMAKQFEQMNQQIAESVSKQSLNEEQVKQSASIIALNTARAILAKTQSDWHEKVSQAQINESLARIEGFAVDSNLKSAQQVTEYAKQANLLAQKFVFAASARKSDVEASRIERQERGYTHGSESDILTQLETAIRALSPIKFGK
ncbi:MAG: DNA pilot protein [Chaetfec virus UA24_2329]|nr:MAG: DNA pilot protein [Chaetfec virus UA24_2329]